MTPKEKTMIYRNRKSDIESAFRLLEEAAKEKEEQIKEASFRLSPLMNNLISTAFDKVNQSISKVEDVIKDGQEVSKSVLFKLQNEVDRDPWKFLGKVAVCSFGIGFVIGIYSRPKPKVVKEEK
jgi:hypothetical protein